MARKRNATEDDLYEIATYLSRSEVEVEIHAELPDRHQTGFEEEYGRVTRNYPLPHDSDKQPYYVWPSGTNKQGRQLRIYFKRIAPEPPPISALYTDRGKWKDKYRVNHSNLVMQLFECGFVLGGAQDENRIRQFMQERFPVRNGESS